MRIDDISIKPSKVTPGYCLHIEINGYQFTGYFDALDGLLSAVAEAGQFFMVKLNTKRAIDLNLTLPKNH